MCKLKDSNLEMIQVEEEIISKNSKEIFKEHSNPFRKDNRRIRGISEGEDREKTVESLFKEIIAEHFPNLGKELDLQAHEAKETTNNLNTKRPSPSTLY